MKIKWTSVFTFDVYFYDGWENCVRFRILDGTLIPCKKYGKIPDNYMQLTENRCKSRKLQPKHSV